jgi:MFS family permease
MAMFQALRVRDFRLLWAGGLVSSVGTWLLSIAVPAHVLQASGSLRDTGLTLVAEYVPQLVLGPFAGVAADRWDRRRLMIGANAACAAAVAVLLLGIPPGRYWVIYLALAAETSFGLVNAPAAQARIPEIIGTGTLLSGANSLSAATSGVVRLIGGPLGGALLAVLGIRWLICADVLSYLAAAVAVAMTARTGAGAPRRAAATAAGDVLADLQAGVRAVRGSRLARGLLAVMAVFLAANASLSAVLIPFGLRRLGGSEHTGLMLAALGAGFLLAAPLLPVLLDRVQARHALAASLAASAGAYFLLFSATSLAAALPAAVAVGLAGSVALAVPQTAIQRGIANGVLGRVSAAFVTTAAAATLLGAIVGPFFAQAAGIPGAAVAASVTTLAAAALALALVPARPEEPPRPEKQPRPEHKRPSTKRLSKTRPAPAPPTATRARWGRG